MFLLLYIDSFVFYFKWFLQCAMECFMHNCEIDIHLTVSENLTAWHTLLDKCQMHMLELDTYPYTVARPKWVLTNIQKKPCSTCFPAHDPLKLDMVKNRRTSQQNWFRLYCWIVLILNPVKEPVHVSTHGICCTKLFQQILETTGEYI